MKIGELAALTKCETETIRFYEKQGHLHEAFIDLNPEGIFTRRNASHERSPIAQE